MAVESPAGCWTKAEAAIADALSNSAAFQSRIVDASSAVEAADSIFGDRVGEPWDGEAYTKEELQELRHYAQVYSSDESPYGKQRRGTNRFSPFGTAVLFIEKLVTEYEKNTSQIPQEIERRFKISVETVIDEVLSYLEDNGGPYITGIVVSDGPGFNDRKQWDGPGMWQGVELLIEWGYR